MHAHTQLGDAEDQASQYHAAQAYGSRHAHMHIRAHTHTLTYARVCTYTHMGWLR